MGIGAAFIMPSTLSLLTNVFPDPIERGRAIGIWAAVAGAAGSVGPVLGGFLLGHFWWGSVFLINVPVAAAALIAGRFLLPSSKDPSAPRLDPPGALLSVAGLVALLWAIIEAPTQGWSSTMVVAGFLAGATILFGFVTWELRSDHPMLDVRFFRNRRFTAANAGITMVYFAMFGSMFLMTQYLQTVLGYSALQAGVRMLPMAAADPMSWRPSHLDSSSGSGQSWWSAAVSSWRASAWWACPGCRCPTATASCFSAMSFMSTGMGLVMAPATESIMGSLPPSKAGVGSAMNDTTRQMGGALGVAVIGSVLATFYRPGISSALAPLHLPASAIATAKDSVGGAVGLAGSLPPSVGQAVAETAKRQFVDGLGIALVVAAIVAAAAAVLVFAFLPARAVPTPAEVSSEAEEGGLARREGPELVLPVDTAGLVLGDSARLSRATEGT